MKKSPGDEELDTVRMPNIVSFMCSFKAQFILYSFIYFLCLCMLVCGHAYTYFIYMCGFTDYNLTCDVAKFMAENGRGNGSIKRKKITDTKAPGNSYVGRYKQNSVTTQCLISSSRPMPVSLLAVTCKSVSNIEGSCIFCPVIPHSPVKINLKTEASPKKVVARVRSGLVVCCGIKHDYTFEFLWLAFRTTWAGKKIQECSYGPSNLPVDFTPQVLSVCDELC